MRSRRSLSACMAGVGDCCSPLILDVPGFDSAPQLSRTTWQSTCNLETWRGLAGMCWRCSPSCRQASASRLLMSGSSLLSPHPPCLLEQSFRTYCHPHTQRERQVPQVWTSASPPRRRRRRRCPQMLQRRPLKSTAPRSPPLSRQPWVLLSLLLRASWRASWDPRALLMRAQRWR